MNSFKRYQIQEGHRHPQCRLILSWVVSYIALWGRKALHVLLVHSSYLLHCVGLRISIWAGGKNAVVHVVN